MIPPPFSTLSQNPQFAALYARLTTLLNPDGSQKPSSEEASLRAKIESDLRSAQTSLARFSLIRNSLLQLPTLPTELQDFVPHLFHPTPHLPEPPQSLPLLSSPLSTYLHNLLTHLLPLISPDIKLLHNAPAQITDRRTRLIHSQQELQEARTKLAAEAVRVLETQKAVAETAVGVLEGVKFGSVKRGIGAEVGYLGAVAEGMEEKLRLMHLETLSKIYTPPIRLAIETYSAHLAHLRAELKEREREASRTLMEFESVDGMRDVLERYKMLAEEKKNVGEQVSRLGRGEGY